MSEYKVTVPKKAFYQIQWNTTPPAPGLTHSGGLCQGIYTHTHNLSLDKTI